ncbi:MAG: putative solute:sodium symporter small subunit [Arenicella sp.]
MTLAVDDEVEFVQAVKTVSSKQLQLRTNETGLALLYFMVTSIFGACLHRALKINKKEHQLMKQNSNDYWQANLKIICTLLVIWFTVPFLGGIVFVEFFNQFRLGGYPLGFWIAQQGSIYLFVVLIFYYARKMSQLDDKFSNGEES